MKLFMPLFSSGNIVLVIIWALGTSEDSPVFDNFRVLNKFA